MVVVGREIGAGPAGHSDGLRVESGAFFLKGSASF
jgi:hypothetical protein